MARKSTTHEVYVEEQRCEALPSAACTWPDCQCPAIFRPANPCQPGGRPVPMTITITGPMKMVDG